MIDDSKNNESHLTFIRNFIGPLRSSFFCLPSLRCYKQKKSSRVYAYPLVRIHFAMLIFIHVRTLGIQFRTRVISQNPCIFTFWDLILTSKLKNLSQMRYKIILPLSARTYQVCFKFLARPSISKPVRTYVKRLFHFFTSHPYVGFGWSFWKKVNDVKYTPKTIHSFKAWLAEKFGLKNLT